ncbi:hypothetical protein LTS18_002767, partial [Coniosporium uncinatum]
ACNHHAPHRPPHPGPRRPRPRDLGLRLSHPLHLLQAPTLHRQGRCRQRQHGPHCPQHRRLRHHPGGDTAAQTAAVTTASKSLQKALTDGATSVKSATPLNLADALGLVAPTQQLASIANTTITNLIGKKCIIDGAGADGDGVDAVRGQRTATAAFGEAVVGKVPAAVATIVRGIANLATEAIERGLRRLGER